MLISSFLVAFYSRDVSVAKYGGVIEFGFKARHLKIIKERDRSSLGRGVSPRDRLARLDRQ